jgi:DNA polymerase III alpha subunit
MLYLRTRTQYSSEQGKPKGTGTVQDLVDFAVANKMEAIALTDTNCFGHREFQEACLKAGIEPIFGMEFQWPHHIGTIPRVALAKNQDGLRELYSMKAGDQVSDDIMLLPPALDGPAYIYEEQEILHGLRWPNDAYAIFPRHLCEYNAFPSCDLRHFSPVRIPKAQPPQIPGMDIHLTCTAKLTDLYPGQGPEYLTRLDRLALEVGVIRAKGFEGYFRIVAEVCDWAARVGISQGPGRGSSSGSLVAFLLGITEVDPIKHGLLFERFLDPSRTDMPDIDLDFEDERRDEIFAHLENLYGPASVARVGTILSRAGKAALQDGLRALGLPQSLGDGVRDRVQTRLAGEEGPPDTLQKALEDSRLVSPIIASILPLEGTVKALGQHAAGVLIAPGEPLSRYCRVENGVAQLDMRDAEALGLLKLDCLGLRTLTVLRDFPWPGKLDMEPEPEDFQDAQANRWQGVFQFEGGALRSIAHQVPPVEFNDLAIISAIARPGPLAAGVADAYKRLKLYGEKPQVPELIAPHLAETHGLMIYQEQVMAFFKSLGLPDTTVTKLRKAIAKSQGAAGLEVFKAEYLKQGLTTAGEKALLEAWDFILGCGAYLFNKSHAVAYAWLSWACLRAKRINPLEFYAACLNHAADSAQGIEVIREARSRGFVVKLFDPQRSDIGWTVQHGELVGGWCDKPGIGPSRAETYMKQIEDGCPTDGCKKAMALPSIYDTMDKVDGLRKEHNLPAITRVIEQQGVRFVGVLDYIKEFAGAKGARWVMRIGDETGSLEVFCSGKTVEQYRPQLERLVVGQAYCIEASLFPSNGKYYFRGVL